ncbi:MAG: metallophosphoesterase family protein [Oscillospiraceae bacterium]|nr:metallophosphoesterase family protein [Oscillospiraceae bacterium]
MIYVTGDTHGDIDRFKSKDFKRLKRNDTLIVLGDFGFLWDNSKQEKKNLKWLSKRPYYVLFLDGSHENYDMLKEYDTEDFMCGQAKHIMGNIYHLQRGEIFTIEGKTLFCFGGAESLDREDRTEGVTWWRAEMPTSDELERAEENLKYNHNQIDYILTHDAPAKLLTFMNLNVSEAALFDSTNHLQCFFDKILTTISYRRWLFARHHRDTVISSRATAVYRNLICLDDKIPRTKVI